MGFFKKSKILIFDGGRGDLLKIINFLKFSLFIGLFYYLSFKKLNFFHWKTVEFYPTLNFFLPVPTL